MTLHQYRLNKYIFISNKKYNARIDFVKYGFKIIVKSFVCSGVRSTYNYGEHMVSNGE